MIMIVVSSAVCRGDLDLCGALRLLVLSFGSLLLGEKVQQARH
jgi:hypothetical protein